MIQDKEGKCLIDDQIMRAECDHANSRCGQNPSCVLDKIKGKSGTFCSTSQISGVTWISDKSLKRSTCESKNNQNLKDKIISCYPASDYRCTKHYAPYKGIGCSVTCLN